MSLKYRSVHSRLWNCADFRACDGDTQRLWLWLLTGPHANSVPGLVTNARVGAIADNLDLAPRKVERLLANLERLGLRVDRETGTLWFPRGAEDVPRLNLTRKNVVGWRKLMAEVPRSCPFWSKVFDDLCERVGDRTAGDGTPYRAILAGETGDRRQKQETETETETETGDRASSVDSSMGSSMNSSTHARALPPRNEPPGQLGKAVTKLLAIEDTLREDLGLPKLGHIHRDALVLALLRDRIVTPEQAEHGLRVLHAEAKSDPTKGWLMDGKSTWSSEVITRAMGRAIPKPKPDSEPRFGRQI